MPLLVMLLLPLLIPLLSANSLSHLIANVFFVAVLITSILLNVLKSEVPIKSGLSTVDPAGNDPATP